MNVRSVRVISVASAVIALVICSAPAYAAQVSLSPSTCGALQAYQDGTFGPMLCPNGYPNVKAESKVAQLTPNMARLGAHPTWKQVAVATCADVRQASYPIVTDSYQWLHARYDSARSGLPSVDTYGTRVVNGLCG